MKINATLFIEHNDRLRSEDSNLELRPTRQCQVTRRRRFEALTVSQLASGRTLPGNLQIRASQDSLTQRLPAVVNCLTFFVNCLPFIQVDGERLLRPQIGGSFLKKTREALEISSSFKKNSICGLAFSFK